MPADAFQPRILAIKLADLGDLLLCEPAFRSLRSAFPSARIDVLTTPNSAPLLTLIGHDLRVIPFPKQLFDSPRSLARPAMQWTAVRLAIALRMGRYDRVVILHHLTTVFGARKFGMLVTATGSPVVAGLDNGRGAFLTHRVFDRGFGARHEAEYMRDVAVAGGGASVDPAPALAGLQAVEPTIEMPDRYAAIFPATGPFSNAREWPADRFAIVARRLAGQGVSPVIVGGDDARKAAAVIVSGVPSAIDATGRTSLHELSVVLKRARIAIGGDTFIGHLAAAVGTPVVSIFGPSNADAWRPFGSTDADAPATTPSSSLVVRHDLPCEPCVYTGFRLGRPQGCPDRTCLKLVTTDDVDNAITRALGAA